MSAFLVLVESASNQHHIFETNKMRENVGASAQIAQVGVDFVLDAVHDARQAVDSRWSRLALESLTDPQLNPPLESTDSPGVEVWYVSSGKAMLLVRDREVGRSMVRRVTLRALAETPGVMVFGGMVAVDPLCKTSLEKAIKDVHQAVARKRTELPSSASRFLRLPVTAGCRSSGLPASHLDQQDGGEYLTSVVSHQKAGFLDEGLDRMRALVPGIPLAGQIQDLERQLVDRRFLAVVHADGNGVGRIFEGFANYLPQASPRQLIDAIRRFSLGLDRCTKQAFRITVTEFREQFAWEQAPILPLIVAGDDVTLILDGTIAVPFMATFLRQFELAVAECDDVALVAHQAFGVKRLGMGAGIAIVKPHYPFFAAYRLAEDLARSAKGFVKQRLRSQDDVPVPCSSLDFHLHHASSGDELDEVRQELKRSGGSERLYGGPYLVTPVPELGILATSEAVRNRAYDILEFWFRALQAPDPEDLDRRVLPASQMHEIRAALFEGLDVAEARWQLIAGRYGGLGLIRPLAWKEDALTVTRLLDAMALAKIVPREAANSANLTAEGSN